MAAAELFHQIRQPQPPPGTSERAPDYSAYYDAMATFLLYESASGYALFEGLDMDEIGQTAEAVQETITYVTAAGPFFHWA